MKLKLATLSDFEEIYALWQATTLSVRESAVEKYDFSQILKLNPTSCFVGIEKNKIIATVFGTFNGRRAWIYHLAIHPDFQKQGNGSLLLMKTEKALKARGASKIIVGVAFDNTEVMPFYNKNGYQIMNDAILLSKSI